MPNTDFDFNAFWSYKRNLKYDRAENIKDFFRNKGFKHEVYYYKDNNTKK